jgi:hypothetical protein
MHEGHLQPVLRCAVCNKPFDRESTLKRHGYYCRSRKSTNITRTRACEFCVKAKARCDQTAPECSRCKAKAIQCQYPAKRHGNRRPPQQRKHGASATPQEAVVPPLHGWEPNYASDGTLANTSATSDLSSDFLQWDDLDWDLTANLTESLPVEVGDKIGQDVVPSIPSFSEWAIQGLQVSPTSSLSNVSLPRGPTMTIRSLIRRNTPEPRQRKIANLILSTLKSYPLMMMRDDTLPPFIAPLSSSRLLAEDSMETLLNCISLIRMIGSGYHASRKMFWRNVRVECERLCDQVTCYSVWHMT